MSGALPFGKFFWSDYASDPALKICSFAAQGLWMRMLCIAAEHDPVGYVAVNGKGLDAGTIARASGGASDEVSALLSELESNGVFSRDRRGWIYSRRMIRDAKKARNARENGKKGGNPSLGKKTGNHTRDNLSDNGRDKPHIPETRDQRPESTTSTITHNIKQGDGADAPNGTYAFFGRTVRLKPNDLERWRRTFHTIHDLDAELSAIDAWFEGQDDTKRKQWFHVTAGSLNRKHQELLGNEKQAQAPPAWDGMP